MNTIRERSLVPWFLTFGLAVGCGSGDLSEFELKTTANTADLSATVKTLNSPAASPPSNKIPAATPDGQPAPQTTVTSEARPQTRSPKESSVSSPRLAEIQRGYQPAAAAPVASRKEFKAPAEPLIERAAPAPEPEDPIPSAIDAIRSEATLPNLGPKGRPLPLLASWNTGEWGKGFTPNYQMTLLDAGRRILPWFAQPDLEGKKFAPQYYSQAIDRCASLKLPISFVGSQWEQPLAGWDKYAKLPAGDNPCVVHADGTVERLVSPFGPVDAWREVGGLVGTAPMLRAIQDVYPNPPIVFFLSNNEQQKLIWNKVADDRRFAKRYPTPQTDEAKRKIVGDGWIERYATLQAGLKGSLKESWRPRASCVGYNAFGPEAMSRWVGWMNYSLPCANRISPWPTAWDGGSPSYYVNSWEASGDFYVWSPQIQSMNWVFMLDEARRAKPAFWFEMSVWDGHEPKKDNDKRKYYAKLGQSYTPARYAGMVQFGMWLLRPRLVREFRGHTETIPDCEPWFLALADAVDRVHRNPTLRKFWRHGALVPNRKYPHPYQQLVPPEYAALDRWFLLDTSADPARPWSLHTPLPVYALALVRGQSPHRSWLVYAHAPTGEQRQVTITIPGHKSTITVTVPVGGSFHLVDEFTNAVAAVAK